MQTPHRMTLAEFRDPMKQFLSVRCFQRDRTLVCPECESRIAYRRTSISIHDSSFQGQVCQFERVDMEPLPSVLSALRGKAGRAWLSSSAHNAIFKGFLMRERWIKCRRER
jgi:hypothetical protein